MRPFYQRMLIWIACRNWRVLLIFRRSQHWICRRHPASILLARDEAFSFYTPHLLAHWRRSGAEISFFSPLADEAPHQDASIIWLPGGYPELHAGRLAAAGTCFAAIRAHADKARPW